MLNDYLQTYSITIVFLGNFNPVIIQPYWLVNKKLVGELEGQSAKVEVIHNDLVKYSLDWVRLEITQDRFILECSQEPYFESVVELASNIFRALPETPVRALGINHIKHYALPDKELYYQFGNKLAPLENWKSFLNNPRLLGLEILDNKPKDNNVTGFYRITINPSDIIPSNLFGVAIRINDHYTLDTESKATGGEIVKILKSNWPDSSTKFSEMIEKLWQKINN